MIQDVNITPLKRISNEKGDIFHALKFSEKSFTQFGEAYFSTVYQSDIKGWKQHTKMVLNLVVPIGIVKFVLFDNRVNSPSKGSFQEVLVSADNYVRLTVPPNVWLAFQGKSKNINMLLNIASIEHDPTESNNCSIDTFDYNWS
jgi:dTDP-4-dehydrorhamnose 3,5-epimerase